MIIGKFSNTANGGYTGSIETLAISKAVVFEPVTEKKHEDIPDFRVTANYRDIGAAWHKTTEEGKPFLSVELDDPTFPKPISCALFPTRDGDGHILTWTRDRKRR